MPRRHGDTDLHDDFPVNYIDHDIDHLSAFLLRYDIKYQDKNVIDMDTFLKLPSWTKTVFSRGDPIPEDQRPKPQVTPPLGVGVKILELTTFQKSLEKPNSKIAAAREKKEQQSLAKAEAKRAGAGGAEGPKKKRKVQKHHESIQSGSEEILLITPLHQAAPEVAKKPTPDADVAPDTPHVKKEVVDLSGNTCVPTPPAATTQPSPHIEHHDTHENAASDAHSSQSSHQGHEDEPVNNRRRISRESFKRGGRQSCLSDSGAVPKLERLRLSLQRANQDNEGLTKKLTMLDNAHSDCPYREKELSDKVKYLERERNEWRATASDQVEKIRSLEKDLEPRTQQLKVAKEKVGVLESEKLALSAKVALAEADRKNLIWEFIPKVVERLHTSVDYRKTLATPVSLCFTAGWLGGLA
ncbi:hypothetical protein Tco_0723477 [Tanacetum coccineum]